VAMILLATWVSNQSHFFSESPLDDRYYQLGLRDSDSVPGGELPYTGEQFKLRLSDEHQGFCFEIDMVKAPDNRPNPNCDP